MSDTHRIVKNPLLSAAGQGSPFENFPENVLLMPVTPATPAVLSDDVELKGLAGQNLINPSPATISTTVDYTSGNTIVPTSLPEEPRESTTQPQKQGYFTSILSSLPNLSLSSIKGESNKAQEYHEPQQGQYVDPYLQNPYGPPPGPPTFLATNPCPPKIPFESNPVPPQPVAPPTTLPPSGGPGSYRLGNQRRLKYAPPPDLTSSAPKQYQVPSSQTFAPPTSALRPQFLNPNAPIQSETYSPQVSTGLSSGQANSTQSPFRNSPVVTPFSTTASLQTFSQTQTYSSNAPPGLGSFSSPPENIPGRFPEPLTPQNTPAATSFPGFSAYEKQSPFGFPESRINYSALAFDSISTEEKKKPAAAAADEKTFTPISAAKVSEKLENFIAEQEEELLTQKSSDFSPEVSEITSRILLEGKKTPEEQRDFKKSVSNFDGNQSREKSAETLTEIDLNAPLSEIPLSKVDGKDLNANPASTFSTVSFFSEGITDQKSNLNHLPPAEGPEFPTFYNPIDYQNQNQNQNTSNLLAASQTSAQYQSLHLEGSNPSGVCSDPVGNVPYSSWTINKGSQSAVLNPVYGAAVHPAPAFYNPNQFANQFSKPLNDPFETSTFPKTEGGSLSDCLPTVDVSSGYYSPSTISSTIPEPTGKAILSPVQTSVNPMSRVTQGTVPQSLENLAAGITEKRMQYRPVYHHWFYRKEVETKVLWIPFSMHDSLKLEEIHNSNEISPGTKVATDGGRYDVDILRRERTPVYWPGAATEVRRCSWFYKGPSESRYTPYEESVAAKFEEEFKQACANNCWNRKIDLNNGEYIVFHSPTVQAHYLETPTPETAASWANSAGSEDSTYLQGVNTRPRVVKRGVDEFHIEDGEPEKVDHLLFLVHGIGSVCDLKFRSVEEVGEDSNIIANDRGARVRRPITQFVDEFRSISLQLVQSHYRSACDQGVVNRIEVLPVSWHATLHSEDTGIDKKLEAITLTSIPKLRHFTNDTLLDILFYTSPVYCQTIMKAVGTEMNRLYALFNERNSNFEGNVYLGGHSLGSLILFDLLCHQTPSPSKEKPNETTNEEPENAEAETSAPTNIMKRKLSRKLSYVMGAAGTGQPYIQYPQLSFNPRAFFALGSPIGMFVTVRGIDTLGEDFVLPTCPAFFNVFHPFDPVAYRVESLINPQASKYRPKLIPHHKGRKRMHLELKETMARVGADLKQKLLDSVRSTWNSVYQLAMFHKPDNQALEREIDKVVEEQMSHPPSDPEVQTEDGGEDLIVGKLNGGRRIDYVLQEAPFEYINEYIFALSSHVCYWESEDTMLLMLKEVYGSMGIQTDTQLPQNLSIERVSAPSTPGPSSYQNSFNPPISVPRMDPTAPITNKTVGPPPTAGFVRKS